MPFMRIILPLVIAAAFIFTPLLEESSVGSYTGADTSVVSGQSFVGTTVECAMAMELNPMAENCRPAHGTQGWLVYAAIAIGVIAAVIGVLGLLPFLNGLASLFTTLSGAVALAAAGWLLYRFWQADVIADVQWGLWLAGGAALITLMVGFGGMRSSSD